MTELIWDGKYTADGKRSSPVRVALPFQTVETVNESAQRRQLTLDSLLRGQAGEWRNRLIWGDKKYVLPSLLPEFAGKVDLIYIDPPFDTGADFSFTTRVPDSDASFTKEPSIIEQKAYRDTWGRGLDSYLQWFYETVVLLHELLAETGSIYVHLDWHVGHYAKAVLDEVFGSPSFQNEIVWKRTTAHSDAHTWSHVTDVIFFYSKSATFTWTTPYTGLKEVYITSKYTQVAPDGRRYRLDNLTSPNPRPNMTYEWKGSSPPAFGWRYSRETMATLDAEGRIWYPDSTSKRPQLKRYLDESKGELVDNLWEDISPVNSQAEDRTGYRTQKPDALLERILTASSNNGDLVLDCFAGSGTTAVVAEELGRRWITCDLGRFAIQTTRKRLLSIPDVRPFAVQNLGKYERQAWQAAEFQGIGGTSNGGTDGGRQDAGGPRFTPTTVEGGQARCRRSQWARRPAGRLPALHPRPVRRRAAGGLRLAAWPQARPLRACRHGRCPRHRRRCQSRGARVLASRRARHKQHQRRRCAGLGLRLRGQRNGQGHRRRCQCRPRLQAHPTRSAGAQGRRAGRYPLLRAGRARARRDLQGARGHAGAAELHHAARRCARRRAGRHHALEPVDWDYRDDTFHNQWQSYRTRKDPALQCSVAHTYDAPGCYTIVAKVIDILGNDSTKSMSIEIA